MENHDVGIHLLADGEVGEEGHFDVGSIGVLDANLILGKDGVGPWGDQQEKDSQEYGSEGSRRGIGIIHIAT